MLHANVEPASPEGGVKETKLIWEAVQVGIDVGDMRRLCRLGGSQVHGGKGSRALRQAAAFLFSVHSGDSPCDLGPVTFPQHRCLSICEIKAPVSVTQALLGRGRLMRRSLQSV